MREILFRIKDKWCKDWYYGMPLRPVDADDETCAFQGEDKNGSSYYNILAETETLGQYTGLKDKNGTKIFEGDIVQSITEDTHEKRFAVIKFGKYRDDNFEDSAIGFYFEMKGYQFSMFNGEAQGYDFPSFVEVVGNIYDNPELLEGL